MEKKINCPRINVVASFGPSKTMPDQGKTHHKFPRLMEKTSLDTRKSRNMSWYEDTRTTYKQNADYLKRLSSLRDSLIDQEQTNLAQAIERLRAKEISKESQHKPRIKPAFEFSEGNNKKFITTLEKFKQSRPKKFPPELYPLEGKQLIEPQPSRTPQLSEKSGSATSVTRSTAEDSIVRSNLQRLIAPITPTSSIPNIGRKSQKTKQQLILESSPIHRKKSCLSADNTDKNPFKNVHKGGLVRKVTRPDLDELDLSPKAVKFEKMGDNDRLNIDKLKEYYCVYYLPSNTPTCQDEIESEDGENNGSNISNDDSYELETEKNKNMDPYVKDIDEENNRFPSEHYRYKAGYFGASQRVPERKPMIHPVTGKALVTNMEDIRKHRLRRLHLSNSVNSVEQDSNAVVNNKDPNNRKQIIVDMPSIVFNAPTPEVTDIELRATLLAKAYKQNELRQRELKNLLDDVKELNKRSDNLSDNIPFQSPSV